MHRGTERTYVVRIPSSLPAGRVPLVIVLHGGGGNAFIAERMTGFTEKANREGFIVVYPDGSGRRGTSLLTWNARHCCGYAMENDVDDVGFIRALIDKLVADGRVDASRVYVTGMSNGGMLSHRLGSELSDRIAAIAPVVGGVFGDEPLPARPVPALMINGLQDRMIPYEGGLTAGRFGDAWDGTPLKAVLEQGTYWARSNRCEGSPAAQDHGRFTTYTHRCPPGSAVRIYVVNDMGHAWPGGQPGTRRADKPSDAINATDVIWSFFREHHR